MMDHPYLANAIVRFPMSTVEDSESLSTMATDGYRIYANVEFCDRLGEEELMGVLAHEVLHNVLGHIERRRERNLLKWNIAIDHATNLLLQQMGFLLPDPKCCDPRYKGMTAESIYDILPEDCNSNWDEHLEYGLLERTSRSQQETIDDPSPLELKRIRETLRIEMTREIERFSKSGLLHGNLQGLIEQEIEIADSAKVDWQEILSRFIEGTRRSDFRNFPFNKKHLWRGIHLPSVGTPGPEKIVASIDTSGSMSNEILSQVLAELDRIKSYSECGLTLIECDCSLERVCEVEPWEVTEIDFERWTFTGRGGTSLIPPFEWLEQSIEETGIIPDAMIYMTDGYGLFPDDCPIPTLWIVPQSGLASDEFPFGDVVRISDFQNQLDH